MTQIKTAQETSRQPRFTQQSYRVKRSWGLHKVMAAACEVLEDFLERSTLIKASVLEILDFIFIKLGKIMNVDNNLYHVI